MAKKRSLSPKSVWDARELEAALAAQGVKALPRHIRKIYRHLTLHPAAKWDEIPDLPRAAVQLLEQQFVRCTSTVEECRNSSDGETTKLLVKLQDGLQVEAVIMRYDTTANCGAVEDEVKGNLRATLCVSSQVGCQMGCTFCATGNTTARDKLSRTMGLVADLTAGEILEQLLHARAVTAIRNIVFMGMGEPLNNYVAVRDAVAMMINTNAFGLRRSAVTVSTVGVVPRILQLVEDLPGVSLALSLHAPTQELRAQIVPSARAYKLDRLMEAIAVYQEKSGQKRFSSSMPQGLRPGWKVWKGDHKVMIEYVMLSSVNDQLEHAHAVGNLLRGRNVVLNLIPWNPVFSPGMAFSAPTRANIAAFHDIVRRIYGVPCTTRQEKGQDISGACGQLVIESSKQGCSKSSPAARDIEELARPRPLVAA